MREFYPANDDLNDEHMATALQVSVAVLPITKIVNLLENPPDDGITNLPPVKPKQAKCTFSSPEATQRKVFNI